MKWFLQLCSIAITVRLLFALMSHLRGDYDTARIPTVALTQVACIVATAFAVTERSLFVAFLVTVCCFGIAVVAHVLSMPGLPLLDASIAQASELTLPIVAIGLAFFWRKTSKRGEVHQE